MRFLPLSVDEIIQTLKRSSLPTVITEGRDDYSVFRFLENRFNGIQISVLPVGGKSVVLEIFSRRSELTFSPLFIIDRDLWVFSAAPDDLQHEECVVLTEGFSIENDVFIDGKLLNVLSAGEKKVFYAELDEICRWFAFAIERMQHGESASFKHNPHQVFGGPLSGQPRRICNTFKSEVGFEEPGTEIYLKIRSDYQSYLRGKTLISLLSQHCSKPKRIAKHSAAALLEFGATVEGACLQRVISRIEEFFAVTATRNL